MVAADLPTTLIRRPGRAAEAAGDLPETDPNFKLEHDQAARSVLRQIHLHRLHGEGRLI